MKVAFGVREGPYKKSCQTWSLDLYIVVLLVCCKVIIVGLIEVPSHARVIEVRTAEQG